jgi:single-strand DNA-binding protein
LIFEEKQAMAKDLNKVMLTGRLGKDVELRVTPNGSSVATFSVASSRNVKDGDGWKEQTEWFNVVAWEKLAETCANYLHKGSRVYIEGRLQTREYEKDGQKRYFTEVITNDLIMLDSKKQESGDNWDSEAAPAPAANNRSYNNRGRNASSEEDLEPEDIPF